MLLMPSYHKWIGGQKCYIETLRMRGGRFADILSNTIQENVPVRKPQSRKLNTPWMNQPNTRVQFVLKENCGRNLNIAEVT